MSYKKIFLCCLFLLLACQDIQYSQRSRYTRNYKNIKSSPSVKSYGVSGKYTGYYKVGKPYEINGIRYYPQEYEYYKEIGLASWYGDDFHNKKTANGETFNMNEMTAAHKTLPLPSIVRVTNLENGRSVVVRVNDRGPFVDNRIIDLSKKAADALGFKHRGLITVRVELLKKETENFLKKYGLK